MSGIINVDNSEPRVELLCELAKRAGCEYISDLRGKSGPVRLKGRLNGLDASLWSGEEWAEALMYLFSRAEAFDSPERALAILLERIEE